ncbi:MAG: 50S ribosomal protein L23 [Patescibacteria group bacterium]|nr:50S ribosomal protein L23 [Patescibacteria group bacterium]
MMIKPIITEKSLNIAQQGWYTFAVEKSLRKEEIRRIIKQLFSVDVVSVRSIRMHGKTRRVGRSLRTILRPDWKKAIVQLKKGQKLDMFDVKQEQGVAQ